MGSHDSTIVMTRAPDPLVLVQGSVWAIGAMIVLKLALLTQAWVQSSAEGGYFHRELEPVTSLEALRAGGDCASTDALPCAIADTLPHPGASPPTAESPRANDATRRLSRKRPSARSDAHGAQGPQAPNPDAVPPA